MKRIHLLIFLLSPAFVLSQIVQLGQDIDGEAPGDESGRSVSLSDDGTIVAIGAPSNQGNGFKSGQVRVYLNNEGSWTQVGEDIDGETTNDYLGYSVQLSADGETVAIGSPYNQGNGAQSGHVRVFGNDGSDWVQLGEAIEGEAIGDLSGSTVSINADGSVIAIGAYLNDGIGEDAGHVRIFKNMQGSWTQVGDDIDGEETDDNSGWSVSINADGTIIAIGAIANDENGLDSGHVRVFKNNGGVWTQIGQDINGEGASDASGWSVSLNDNGTVLAIGAPFNQGNGTSSGHVRIFQNTGGNWTQFGSDIDGENPGDGSGWSVSLNSSGTIVAVGARGNDENGLDSGHVRIFQNVSDQWIQVGADIDGEASGDFSGWAVNLNANGRIVAVGSPFNDDNGLQAGSVSVFDVSDVLGLIENENLDILIYPSPTSGIVKLQSDKAIDTIEVFNQLGEVVLTASDTNEIDLSNHSAGVYFLRLTDALGNVSLRKVIKK